MRTYVAQELIGSLWMVGAMFAKSEGLTRLAITFCAFGVLYFFRAAVNYWKDKTEDERGKTPIPKWRPH